ncbi:prokineticin receptor 2-like [Musca vetustissima]|uniref:prokineticin receptor 2-like n=1 Tax=Musca vetustissima TaxID=27455 RepID=UPI002AB7D8EF|nr:prokineticin receptor 2-like [Musca vetustissima]
MEYFLREYMARSILPHLNVATIEKMYHIGSSSSGAIEPSDSDDSVIDSGDSNLYFIEPQQQLLLDAFNSDMDVRTQSDTDYSEYLSGNSTTASSTSTYHLLESLVSVTTTTISSITHQLTQHSANESFRLLRGDHNVSTSMYAAVNCDGECQPDTRLNETWSLDACGDDDGGEGDTLSSIYFITAVYLLYIPIFVFALLGNGTVCYIVQSTPRMRTVTNYFIANLAMGDILMSLFCVPSSFISTFILGYWPFGIALCHFVNYSQAVSVLVSAYTLVAISIDRYIAIMWPLRPRITKS